MWKPTTNGQQPISPTDATSTPGQFKMRTTVTGWWVLITFACLVFAGGINWGTLLQRLNDWDGGSVAKIIADKWDERPSNFFQSISKQSWARIAGRLSDSQIQAISPEEFDSISPDLLKSLLYEFKACPTIDILFWTKDRIQHISAECLYKILNDTKNPVKFGRLWEKINIESVIGVNRQKESCWQKIDHGDFHFMQPDILKIILPSVPEVCSILGRTFWNKERIEAISAYCLYAIFKEANEPVKLGELWQRVDWHVLRSFTVQMKPSLQKIDLSDYYFMQPQIVRRILEYVPEICSDLGPSFWTRQTIEGISGECLHELLTKRGIPVKLESLWGSVPIDSCHSFLNKMNFSLDSVHPDDRLAVGDWIGRAIEILPYICKDFDVSFWNKETAKYMTRICLCNIISYAKKPVVLGRLWEDISSLVVKESMGSMLNWFKNVSGNDFQYMSVDLLQSIFSSHQTPDYLPWPPSEIVLSAQASEVSMSSAQFANLVKSVPGVAGQLLWYSTKLPENVLSQCSGDNIRGLKLVVPGKVELDWKSLFARMECKYSLDGRAGSFAKMIRLISANVRVHFCATLSDLDEFWSLTWLHKNLSKKCRAALFFDPDHAIRLFSTLNFSKEGYSWRKMLKYNDSDWSLISQSKRVVTLLGGDCDFWSIIDTEGLLSEFMAMDNLMLKSIIPDCVLKMPGILANSRNRIPLLADDAFSKHMAGKLPCRLHSLSPGQIACLSKKNFQNIAKPTAKEISRHVLSGVILDDLKALTLQQFKSLYKFQWVFVPEEIKNDALSWWLDLNVSQALSCMASLNTSRPYPSKRILGQKVNDPFKPIEDTLSLVLSVYRDGYQSIPVSSLALLIDSIRSSSLLPTFIKVIQKSTFLKPTIICLVRDAKELRDYNRKAFKEMDIYETKLVLQYNQKSGFDRPEMIRLLKKTPELFAAPNARVSNQGTIDNGGVVRSLTNQLLADIQRDLVVPYARVATLESEFVAKMKIVDQVEAMDVESGSTKLVWGISKEMGLIIGLVFGKALQLDVRLPFALDRMFYELLIDASDEAIKQYYLETYDQEIAKFRQDIVDLFGVGDSEEPFQTLTRPDSLRFTQLSARADTEEAKIDVATKTNMWGCSDKDCYEHVSQLQDPDFVASYTNVILEKVHNEFKEFIRELIRGLGMALPPVREFKSLPIPFLRPFAKFLPQLLNANPISADQLIGRTNIVSDDDLVIFAGRAFPVSRVLFAFIQSLDKNQPSHLLGVWTGSTTISLGDIGLNVMFIRPDTQTSSIKFDFCNSSGGLAVSNRPAIALGSEYRALFNKFIKKLMGEAESHEPDCPDGGLEFYPTRVATCAHSLMVYTQSLHQMFGSLVDLLNTPLTALTG